MKQISMKHNDEIWGMSVSLDIFRREVIILIASSKKFLIEELETVLSNDLGMESKYAKDFSETLRESLKNETPYLGLTYELESIDNGKETFVIFDGTPKSISRDTVIHEMYHAMRKICNDRGVDDEETEAYMLEYLCHEVLRQVDTWNHKSKKS